MAKTLKKLKAFKLRHVEVKKIENGYEVEFYHEDGDYNDRQKIYAYDNAEEALAKIAEYVK